MRINPVAVSIFLGVLIQFTGTPVYSEGEVGHVKGKSGRGYRIREATPRLTIAQGNREDVLLGDQLKVGSNGELELSLREGSGTITIGEGLLQLGGNDDSPESECNIVNGNVRFEATGGFCGFRTSELTGTAPGTVFEVHAQWGVSRVFVYEGSVSVRSTNDQYPESKPVPAGFWVSASGEEVSDPQRFIEAAQGPGSGSTECIHSDCTLVYEVPIPPPPRFFPPNLSPPPLKPPSRR